jgi:preprotein translocase subunit SecE
MRLNVGAEVKSMEVKKPQQSAVQEKIWTAKKATEFVSDVKAEINKIDWTNRSELIAYTKIVVGATFIVGMAIYGLDLSIQTVLSGLTSLLQLFR